ncbi:MAG: ParA family protein [Burkholderiaceae bacterium]|nr:ParA family protein [Burkholderiaceae bacterium]
MASAAPLVPFVIALANRKGGAGKTTTAVNLAAGLARKGFSTLLIDLDTQGHAGFGLGITAGKTDPTAHDIFTKGDGALAPAIRHTSVAGLDLAPANPLFEHGGALTASHLLARALTDPAIQGRYRVVIVDTPPSLDALLINALTAARGVVIPFVPHPLAAEGVKQFARLFFRIRISTNPDLKILALTPVQVNLAIVLHRQVIDALAQQFGHDKLVGFIRPDIKLAESFAVGRPIFDYAPRSRAATDYQLLTDELVRLWSLDA